jgi:hypothetical protein
MSTHGISPIYTVILTTITSLPPPRSEGPPCTALLELRVPCNVGGLQQRMLGLRLIIGLQTQFPLRFHTHAYSYVLLH